MNIPLLDLKAQYRQIQSELMNVIEEVCTEQSFILGPHVEQFERAIATFIGVKHSIGVASGSDALLLSLMELDIQPGDEVLTTPFTFFATTGVISRLHARPVFVDICADTFNLDATQLAQKITSRTKAILPVHLFGQCADMEAINTVAVRHGIPVIEDACQAIGAVQNSSKAGTLGHTGCLSFFPSKNLGAFGDGGLITTDDSQVAERLRLMRVHGSRSEYHHHLIGMNSRLDALQAAVLQIKLQYLEDWTMKRQNNAASYRQLFHDHGLADHVTLPVVANGNTHVYNQFTIRTSKRDALSAHLTKKSIGNRIYYPVPLHLQECYETLGHHKGDFPVAERAAQEVLSLPIYPELTLDQIAYVVEAIKEFFE